MCACVSFRAQIKYEQFYGFSLKFLPQRMTFNNAANDHSAKKK